jgi:3-oxoacyl-[acyl-carrier protein] reductase
VAKELGRYNVNANCVAPGMVATEMTQNLPEEFLKAAQSEAALGRIAAAEDVANLVVFLCSERARHVTGDCIRVDGGQYT